MSDSDVGSSGAGSTEPPRSGGAGFAGTGAENSEPSKSAGAGSAGARAEDAVIAELREQIEALDRQVLEAVNARLELVAKIRRHKEKNGISFLDPGREEWLLQHLAEINGGPLSEEGVRELFTTILDLVKRELARAHARAAG